MALTLAECDQMINAAAVDNVKRLLGHKKLMQAPVRKMRKIVDSGSLGSNCNRSPDFKRQIMRQHAPISVQVTKQRKPRAG